MSLISPNDIVLFQGDSITDASRNREVQDKPNELWAMGLGYVKIAAGRLLADRPADNLQIYNRGISGHRVVDLYARWKVDCLNLKPDVLSILIGVNDTWHHHNRNNGVEPKRYETIYRMMLDWTRNELPDIKLVLCEPFVLHCGAVGDAWLPEMAERRAIVKQLATDFDAAFVPFQQMFDDAAKQAPNEHWLPDGVHPSPAGHTRMADLWLEKVG